MKQTREINHGDGHIDIETLFGDVWAVTKCNLEVTMARTLNGNLTGKAAHGIDDIYEAQSDYSKRLDIAKSKVKSIFSDDEFFIHWMMRIEHGTMLETMENVIAQVTHYDNGVDLVDVENWQTEAKALAADARDYADQVSELRGGG